MSFNWNAKKLVDNKGRVVKNFISGGSVTQVYFEDGTATSLWTDNADWFRPSSARAGKELYLIAEEEPLTDEELVRAYREADALASKHGTELLERGFTLIDDDGDEVPFFNDVVRIYKLEEKDF